MSFFSLFNLTFNYKIDCVCTMAGHFLRRANEQPRLAGLHAVHSVIVVKDPVRPLSGATLNVTDATVDHILTELRKAHFVMKPLNTGGADGERECVSCGFWNPGVMIECAHCGWLMVSFERDLCNRT
jgi:hypothetical protein